VRDQVQLVLGNPHEHRDFQQVEKLDAADRGGEIPGAVLQIDADPVEAGASGGLRDQRLRHGQPAGEPKVIRFHAPP